MRDTKSSAAVGRLLWTRFIWRHWRREPALTLMLVGILALGVAVFLAVRLANKAAVTACAAVSAVTLSQTVEAKIIGAPLSGSRCDAATPPMAWITAS